MTNDTQARFGVTVTRTGVTVSYGDRCNKVTVTGAITRKLYLNHLCPHHPSKSALLQEDMEYRFPGPFAPLAYFPTRSRSAKLCPALSHCNRSRSRTGAAPFVERHIG